ncbi:MAG: hypothetical protein WC479_07535 [Candidatus Izemoplasmatales bacterium]|jgi:hypothetical protein
MDIEITLRLEVDRDLMESFLITNGYNFVEECEGMTEEDMAGIIVRGLIEDQPEDNPVGVKTRHM